MSKKLDCEEENYFDRFKMKKSRDIEEKVEPSGKRIANDVTKMCIYV